MMIIYLLNVLMLSRMDYTFDDEGITKKQLPYYLIIQGLGLAALTINRAWVVLLVAVVISNGLIILWERKTKTPRIVRIVSLLGFSVVYFIIINLTGGINFNPVPLSWVIKMIDKISIVKDLGQLSRINAYCLGFLFIINESNTIIRQLFDWIKVSPHPSEKGEQEVELSPPSDKYLRIDEYKSGRVIGILERSIVYLAMLSNEYSIIGFILAAKAFARFKELDKKVYAEYVLIGTLASILMALIAASFISVLVH
jgi:hypothetical protein